MEIRCSTTLNLIILCPRNIIIQEHPSIAMAVIIIIDIGIIITTPTTIVMNMRHRLQMTAKAILWPELKGEAGFSIAFATLEGVDCHGKNEGVPILYYT